MLKAKCILIPVLLAAAPAAANEFEDPLRDLGQTKERALISDPAIVAAIIEQNARHQGLTQADIDAMDKI